MIKRIGAAFAAAVVAMIAVGSLSAPAQARVDPTTKCIWIWSSGPPKCQKLE
ncbi:hypothetical protein [Amycolatopsis sp. H20-H5]|uniref:hypothetical protein n=1 Tax=Amycolatopsis sp. H20-H5 TaxID=3046309 RepID=UPI002DBDCB67|nr:hypothetical protein [Amycolatopsis sp. H20-H5]MEC3982809.1 hypothetical protein [Amycolatopsis sp. H20-H5]